MIIIDRDQAAREAKALTAEWIEERRNNGWREYYHDRDCDRIAGELERIQHKFEQHGPSLYRWRRNHRR